MSKMSKGVASFVVIGAFDGEEHLKSLHPDWQCDHYLTLKVGQKGVRLTEECEDGWHRGRVGKQEGYYALQFVEELPVVKKRRHKAADASALALCDKQVVPHVSSTESAPKRPRLTSATKDSGRASKRGKAATAPNEESHVTAPKKESNKKTGQKATHVAPTQKESRSKTTAKESHVASQKVLHSIPAPQVPTGPLQRWRKIGSVGSTSVAEKVSVSEPRLVTMSTAAKVEVPDDDQLQRSKNELENRVRQLESELAANIGLLAEEKKARQQDEIGAEARFHDLEKKCATESARLKELEVELAESVSVVEKEKKAKKDEVARFADLEKRCEGEELRVKELEAEIAAKKCAYEEEKVTWEKERANTASQVEDLENHLATEKSRVKELESEIATKVSCLTEEREAREKEEAVGKARFDDLEERFAIESSRAKKLEGELADSRTALEKEKEAREKEEADAKALLNDLEEKCAAEKSHAEKLEGELADSRIALEKEKEAREKEEADGKALQNDLEERCAAETSRAKKLEGELAESQIAVEKEKDAREKEDAIAKSRVKDLEEQCETESARAKKLEGELAELQLQGGEDARKEFDKAKLQIDEQSVLIAELKANFVRMEENLGKAGEEKRIAWEVLRKWVDVESRNCQQEAELDAFKLAYCSEKELFDQLATHVAEQKQKSEELMDIVQANSKRSKEYLKSLIPEGAGSPEPIAEVEQSPVPVTENVAQSDGTDPEWHDVASVSTSSVKPPLETREWFDPSEPPTPIKVPAPAAKRASFVVPSVTKKSDAPPSPRGSVSSKAVTPVPSANLATPTPLPSINLATPLVQRLEKTRDTAQKTRTEIISPFMRKIESPPLSRQLFLEAESAPSSDRILFPSRSSTSKSDLSSAEVKRPPLKKDVYMEECRRKVEAERLKKRERGDLESQDSRDIGMSPVSLDSRQSSIEVISTQDVASGKDLSLIPPPTMPEGSGPTRGERARHFRRLSRPGSSDRIPF